MHVWGLVDSLTNIKMYSMSKRQWFKIENLWVLSCLKFHKRMTGDQVDVCAGSTLNNKYKKLKNNSVNAEAAFRLIKRQ